MPMHAMRTVSLGVPNTLDAAPRAAAELTKKFRRSIGLLRIPRYRQPIMFYFAARGRRAIEVRNGGCYTGGKSEGGVGEVRYRMRKKRNCGRYRQKRARRVAVSDRSRCSRTWRRHSPLTTNWKPPDKILILRRLSAIPPVYFPPQRLVAAKQ